MITYSFIHFKFSCTCLLSSLIYLSMSEAHVSMNGLHMYVHVYVHVCFTCTPSAQLVGRDPFHILNRTVSSEWRHVCLFDMRIGWNLGIDPNHFVGWSQSFCWFCCFIGYCAMSEILFGSCARPNHSIGDGRRSLCAG